MLVMVMPAIAPMAMAGVAPPEAMHCMRRPLAAAATHEPVMQCHHGAAQAVAQGTPENEVPAAPSGASVRALDCCCNHDCCCRSLNTSEWARPASSLGFVNLLINRASPVAVAQRMAAFTAGADSARAPPRS